MAKQKKPVESVRGTYSAMPHAVMDSPAYVGASPTAKALLCELIRQHNGGNNGRLHLSRTWLASRGWRSRSIVDKARVELIERGLIVETRTGGLGIGPSWHALTWLQITNHVGLETSPNTYHPGGWQLCGLPPTSRREAPAPHWFNAHVAALRERRPRRKAPMKKTSQPDHRAGTGPTTGPESVPAGPTTGPITALSGDPPGPTTGHDVLLPLPPVKTLTPDWRIGGWKCVGLLPTGLIRPRAQIFKTTPAAIGHHHGHTGH